VTYIILLHFWLISRSNAKKRPTARLNIKRQKKEKHQQGEKGEEEEEFGACHHTWHRTRISQLGEGLIIITFGA